MAFFGTNVNWGDIGRNGFAQPVINPYLTISNEGIDKVIKGIGDVLEFNQRKKILNQDPQLEAMQRRLEQLVARRNSLLAELSVAENEEADAAYIQAANLKTPEEKAAEAMAGYAPGEAQRAKAIMEGYVPNSAKGGVNVYDIFG